VFKMSEKWRLLLTGNHTAAENMAIDRAILVAHNKELVPPTVRFYGWWPPAISIGYFQRLTEEIDLSACDKHEVDYVRRITGGGAVFHEDEVTYSIVISEEHPQIPKKILDSYARICGALVKGFNNLDIESVYSPINDIIVDGKKISGNAQTRKMHTVLQHGTILLDVDVDKMFSVLKVSDEKIKDKMIKDVKQRVTSIKHVKDESIDFDIVASAMKKGFEEEFNIELVKDDLIDEELKLTDDFNKSCFSSDSWNHMK